MKYYNMKLSGRWRHVYTSYAPETMADSAIVIYDGNAVYETADHGAYVIIDENGVAQDWSDSPRDKKGLPRGWRIIRLARVG